MHTKIAPPLKNGEKTMLVIKVLDEDKAFDYIGKHLLNKTDGSECGFTIEKMFLNEDRYRESIKEELKQQTIENIQKYGNKMVETIINSIK